MLLIQEALSKLRNALRADPYGPEPTYKMAVAYALVGKKGCSLALLERCGVVSREAAARFYAGAPRQGAPRALGRETWSYAGAGALIGFGAGVAISLIMVAWPGIDAPGGLALVQLAGPNIGTIAGGTIGALIGALRRRHPKPRHARAAEAANAIVVAVAARSEREAELLGQLLAGCGGRGVRMDGGTRESGLTADPPRSPR